MNRPPRIALVRQRYAADGGAERFLARALSALSQRGAELALVTRRWEASPGLDVIPCNPFYVGSVWRDAGFARCACRALAQREFDIVQSHERMSCCDVYRAGDGVHREWLRQRARALGPAGRLRLRLNPYHRYVMAAERRMFLHPRLRAVICNSRMVRDEIVAHFGLAADKLHVIYNGVDTRDFHPDLKRHRGEQRQKLGIPESATLFLFVGSGFERKGVGPLLEAMAELPGAYLLVVGKDKRMAFFERRARDLAVAERVRFVGRQSDVKPFYGAADALALPTLYDPFPNVVLEAMACGLPVVTSTKCGGAELIEEGVQGHVCDALDRAALIRAMRLLLAPERRRDMGAHARTAAAPLDLHNMSERMLALYQALIAGH